MAALVVVVIVVMMTVLTGLLVVGVRLNLRGQSHNRQQGQQRQQRIEAEQDPFLKDEQTVSIPTAKLW